MGGELRVTSLVPGNECGTPVLTRHKSTLRHVRDLREQSMCGLMADASTGHVTLLLLRYARYCRTQGQTQLGW